MISAGAMDLALAFGLVFFICAIAHQIVMRKIVLAAGLAWKLNAPFERVRAERAALRSLGKGELRNKLFFVRATAVVSWFAGLAVMLIATHKQ